MVKALRDVDAVAEELADYWRTKTSLLADFQGNPQVEMMKTDDDALLKGLLSDDASVRCVALLVISTGAGDPLQKAVPVIRMMALNDLDREVQLRALDTLTVYESNMTNKREYLRDLANLAISTDDVSIRHTVYLKLCHLSEFCDHATLVLIFGLKNYANPIIYNEDLVRQFANSDSESVT